MMSNDKWDSADGHTNFDIDAEIRARSSYNITRIEVLKMTIDMLIRINHFDTQYKDIKSLFKDIDVVHKIADYNLKYIMGDK